MKLSELAKWYNKFGFNVLPVDGKRPTIPWENWQLIEQTKKDIAGFGWNANPPKERASVTGIGGICGINEIRNLDFDKVKDPEIVEMFAKRLGLGHIYPWIIRSGSGNGFHIWFKVSESELLHKRLNGPKSVYRLYLKDSDICDHLELRWSNSQTILPYSKHPNGNVYSFIFNGKPSEAPKEIVADVLLECLEEYCDLGKRKSCACSRQKNI